MDGVMETMRSIYPISALSKNQKAVKVAAQNGIVRITEQGVGAYVFGTETEYIKVLERAKAEGALEERMKVAVEAGRADKASGRVDFDIEGFFGAFRKGLKDDEG